MSVRFGCSENVLLALQRIKRVLAHQSSGMAEQHTLITFLQ